MKITPGIEFAEGLSPREAIVLQQVHEDGEEDARSLASSLGVSRQYTLNLLMHLKKRGLVAIDGEIDEIWVRLTAKGKRLINYIWPEARTFALR